MPKRCQTLPLLGCFFTRLALYSVYHCSDYITMPDAYPATWHRPSFPLARIYHTLDLPGVSYLVWVAYGFASNHL